MSQESDVLEQRNRKNLTLASYSSDSETADPTNGSVKLRIFVGTSTFGLGIKAIRLLNGDNDFNRLSLRERPFFLDFSESGYKEKF